MRHSSPLTPRRLIVVAALALAAGVAIVALRGPREVAAALRAGASLALSAAVATRRRAAAREAALPVMPPARESVSAPLAPAQAPTAAPQPAPHSVFALPSAPVISAAPGVPIVLPPLEPLFIGREQELDNLVAALRRARGATATAVVGPAGVGKHTLVARAIESLHGEDLFPDGLSWHAGSDYQGDQGFRRVLIEVLDRFGGPAVAMTSTLRMGEAAVADLVRGKRILFWLDDIPADFPLGRALTTLTARDTHGVGPTLIVTSRSDWVMPEVYEIALDPPALDEAFDLWRDWLDLGGRALDFEEHEAAKAICVNLSYLPLALRLAAGYAAQSKAKLPKLAGDLGEVVFPPGDVARTAERTIAFAEAALFPQPRRAFAALGVFESPVFDLDAASAVAAVVAGTSVATVQTDLAAMVRLGLLEYGADTRGAAQLRLHPLVRRHAAERLAALGPDVTASARAALASVMRTRRQAIPDVDEEADDTAGVMRIFAR